MMKNKLTGLCLLLLIGFSVQAQNFSYEVKCQANEMPINNYDTLFTHLCIVDIGDTLNVDSIHIKVGNTYQGNEVMEHVLGFDQSASLPKDVSYYRRKNKINLGLGNHLDNDYYYEIFIEDTLGNHSTILYWNNVNP